MHEQLIWEALQSLRAWSFGSRHCMNLHIKQIDRDGGYRLPTTLISIKIIVLLPVADRGRWDQVRFSR